MERRQKGERPISRAIKAKLHRKRVAEVERRKRQRDGTNVREYPEQHDQTRQRVEHEDDLSVLARQTECEDYWDEDDESDTDYIDADEVIGLLRRIEWNRKALDDAQSKMKRWFSQSSDLAETYRRFTAAGGIGADDFVQFLNGRFHYRRGTRKAEEGAPAVDRQQ